MSRIVDFYTVTPDELHPGDVMICIVTLHVGPDGHRMYCCHQGADVDRDGIPQGSRLPGSPHLAQALFPVVDLAGIPPEPY